MTETEFHNAAFEKWWRNEGSGFIPVKHHDMEEHAKKVSRIAWLNGAYVGAERMADRWQESHDNSRR